MTGIWFLNYNELKKTAGESVIDSTPRFLLGSPLHNAADFSLMNLCVRRTLGTQYVFNPIQSRSLDLWNLFLNGKLIIL